MDSLRRIALGKSGKNIVAIILARGGSKSFPGKNIRPLNGIPLIVYTIEAAKQSKWIDRIIVSTDDVQISKIATQYGAETPFVRPKELSTYYSTAESALKHAVEWLIKNENYYVDIVVYLQITDVFRKKGMLDSCIKILLDNPEIDSAFMGLKVKKNFWREKKRQFVRLANDIPYGIPRQQRESLYREDTGIALATRSSVILAGKRLGENCHIIPYEQEVDFIDIHSEFDLWLAETIIKEKKIIPNH